ncbi:MAG TPA: LPS export ABC transporter periplasmic protein LptC, partial [Vicinamibacterales bacterium]|nr:LPS export ABC transporter periplasmic protein LptC [Vicinamibacterales bacterium]
MSWQKRARLLLLVVAVGVAAAVFVTTRRRETPPPPAAVPRVDPAAVVESSGAFLVQVKGDRETVTIRADKQLSYPDGSSRLLGVTVTSVRQGKAFVVTGQEARVGENQTNLDMKGNVRMLSSDGLNVSADSATYAQTEGIVRAPGPVTFMRGRMSGSGIDFSYDENNDLMGLTDQTKVKIAGDKKGSQPIDITSGSAVLARRDKFVSFERAVHVVHGSQVIDAESALGDLSESQEYLSGLELQGNARIETPAARPGELKLMAGDVINLTYFENSDVLQSAIVSGNSSLRIAGDAGAPERVLHAQNVEIGMAPDGSTVTSLNARDQVVLDLPGAKGQPTKSVSSNSLVASGVAGKGLTAASFTEGVEYRETGGAPAVKRTVTSRTLDTALNGNLGDIREAQFTGSVRLRDQNGGAAANAENMRYHIATGQVELTGTSAGLPRVVNEQIEVDAARVEMSIEGSRMKATGAPTTPVQTVMKATKPGQPGGRRTPGIMQQDRDINGVSAELIYAGGDASSAEFNGAAQLWQEATKGEVTKVKADKISVDGKTGNLNALGSVISTMIVQDINPTTKVRETSRSTGQGQAMIYEDALRKITYKTKATLIGPQGDLRGETIVLTLGANGQDVEQLEAMDGVTLKEVDRETRGEHLTYIASTSEYKMAGKGKLVRMRRTTPEGCRTSEGSLLTFSRVTE